MAQTGGDFESEAAKTLGEQYYRESRFSEAAIAFGEAIEKTSNSNDKLHILYSNRSACFLQLAKFQEARDDAESCTRIKPAWPKGFSRLGGALLRMGRQQEARYAYERLLELEPNNVDAQKVLRQMGVSGGTDGSGNGLGGFALPQGLMDAWMRFKAAIGNNSWGQLATDYAARMGAYWATASGNAKMGILAAVLLPLYYLFFYRRR
jgi:tetratricopeptide (TPR) repeat protein